MASEKAKEPTSSNAVAKAEPEKGTKDKKKSTMKEMLSFFRLILCTDPTWLDLCLIIGGTIFALGAGVPYPIMGIIFGRLVDQLNAATCAADGGSSPNKREALSALISRATGNTESAHAYEGRIDHTVSILAILAAVQFTLVYLHAVCWNIQSQRLTHRLRDKYLRSMLSQEPSFFDDKHAGEVSARLNDDFVAIQSGTSEKIGRLLGQSSFFIAAYVVAFITKPVLAGILVSLVPAFLLMSFVGSHFFKKYQVLSTQSFANASSIASEALAHVSVVQSFGAGSRLEAKFATHMAWARHYGVKKSLVAATQAGLLYFIAYASNALAYWEGSKMISRAINGHGEATVGQIYTVVFLLVDACIIIGGLAPLFPIFGAASAAYERLQADMDHVSSINGTSEEGIMLPWSTPGSVEFRHVGFAYRSRQDAPALKNVNLTFEAGKHTAIVGQSGSGKSTVAALLNRLYNPSSGTILFDGTDMQDINVRNMRGFVSLVQQEAPLFDRSIFENIALGLVNSPQPAHQSFKPVLLSDQLPKLVASSGKDIMDEAAKVGGATAEIANQVRWAAEQADLAFIDKLDLGFATPVGSSGRLVSGGQRQRIALARALIRDPKILVLDEATAALDSATEKKIQAAIDRVAVGRTVVSIAHRLSTIKHADKVVVMRDGEVVEEGTYLGLLEQGGAFAHLAGLQGLDSSHGKNDEAQSLDTDIESVSEGSDIAAGIKEKDETTAVATSVDESSGSGKETPTKEDESAAKATDIEERLPSRSLYSRVNALLRRDYKWMGIAIPSAFIVGATFTAMALIFGNTVGTLSSCASSAARVLYLGRFFGGLIFMLAVVEFFANLGSWSSFGRVSENFVYRVRVLTFRTLMEQSVEWHNSDGRNPTSLLGLITKDGGALAAFSGSIIATVLSVFVNFFVAIIVSHVFAWKIALVCLAMVPLLLGAGVLQVNAQAKYNEKSHKAFVEAIGITVEAVNQIKTIASFSLEDEVVDSYRRALSGPRAQMIKESLHTTIFLSINQSTGFFIYCLSYWWGSQLIMKGEYTQTQFFIVQISMLVSATLWGQMFSLAPEFSRARAAASRTMSLISLGSDQELVKPSAVVKADLAEKAKHENPDATPADSDASSREKAIATPTASGPVSSSRGVSVTFKDVHFAYPSRPNHPILTGMSFTIQPGQFVGLVGPSGAGKSTLMALIQRLYSPSAGGAGTVEINGFDINARPSDTTFRHDMAVVPQDSALFNGSIRFNVGLGARPGTEATDAEIEEACKAANLHDTIAALPDGYDTECGPNGSRLSGGQRQRLAIARALVRKPGLLLLDESTSALDAESERALQVGLERIARGITVVAITHRLHTVQRADVIFIVEGGKVAEKGSHSELVERVESYRVNATQQMLQ